jgi:hypothetical protein
MRWFKRKRLTQREINNLNGVYVIAANEVMRAMRTRGYCPDDNALYDIMVDFDDVIGMIERQELP